MGADGELPLIVGSEQRRRKRDEKRLAGNINLVRGKRPN